MNILTDVLPDTVEVDGAEYPVNSDFRASLRIIMAFEDSELTPQEKQIVTLANLYPEVPPNTAEALRVAQWFMNGGQESEESDGMRLYSFVKDANIIYAAFRQTHGVDLQTVKLHWWQFLALFMDLGSETTFCQLIGLRKRLKTGKATKEERQAAREMGDFIDVPEIDNRTLEEKEKEAEFLRLIGER